VNWDIFDFAVFGAMLLGVGVVYALARRRANNTTYRFGIGVALAAAFLLVWINGAVGIIGDSNNDANMMFFGVLVVGVVGAMAVVRLAVSKGYAAPAFGSPDQIAFYFRATLIEPQNPEILAPCRPAAEKQV
jgi:hypothetical protein